MASCKDMANSNFQSHEFETKLQMKRIEVTWTVTDMQNLPNYIRLTSPVFQLMPGYECKLKLQKRQKVEYPKSTYYQYYDMHILKEPNNKGDPYGLEEFHHKIQNYCITVSDGEGNEVFDNSDDLEENGFLWSSEAEHKTLVFEVAFNVYFPLTTTK